MFGSRVHEDLLGEGKNRRSDRDKPGAELQHVLGLVLVVDLQMSHDSKVDNPEIPSAHLFPGLGGDSHLVNAGSGPVSQGLPSGLVLHQPAGSEERASPDHLLLISSENCGERIIFYHRVR